MMMMLHHHKLKLFQDTRGKRHCLLKVMIMKIGKVPFKLATKGQLYFLAWPTNMREVNSQVIQISRQATKGQCKQNDCIPIIYQMNAKIF